MVEDFDALWKRYWELVGDVVNSKHQFFTSNLQRWLNLIEQDHCVAPILTRLERRIDFDSWYQDCLKTSGSMVGSGALTWPMNADERLGMHLALIRAFASQKIPFHDFCHHFLWTENDFNVMANDIAEQIFHPFSRDLKYEIDRQLRMASVATAPAADRIVPIDHNSAAYIESDKALGQLEEEIAKANDYDPENKEQHIAQISAGRRLLMAVRVSLKAIGAVLGITLISIVTTFRDTAVGRVAEFALDRLNDLLGKGWFPF